MSWLFTDFLSSFASSFWALYRSISAGPIRSIRIAPKNRRRWPFRRPTFAATVLGLLLVLE